VLDVLFVIGLGWKVEGAALASVIADYSGCAFGLWCVWRTWSHRKLPAIRSLLSDVASDIGRFVKLNRDIFLRSLCLQATFSFMTFQGAAFGDDIVAANAVLMSFLMIISYGMDGFAYAMEAMVGKAIGAKSRTALTESLLATFFWSLIICSGLTVVFMVWGSNLIGSITSIPDVQQQAMVFLPWLVAMPLVSMWCFLFDGIFIGATKGRDMRNSMFVATCSFFAIFYITSGMGNHALWLAMLSFMGIRGFGLAMIFLHQWRSKTFLEA
jgi:MATE family multidrug resistance protein